MTRRALYLFTTKLLPIYLRYIHLSGFATQCRRIINQFCLRCAWCGSTGKIRSSICYIPYFCGNLLNWSACISVRFVLLLLYIHVIVRAFIMFYFSHLGQPRLCCFVLWVLNPKFYNYCSRNLYAFSLILFFTECISSLVSVVVLDFC